MMDDSKKILKGVIGEKQSFEALGRDSDGDGSVNPIDCEPNNPNKQGVVHNLVNKARGRLEAFRKENVERKEREFVTKSKAAEAYHEEKEKQIITTAKAKARIEGERERERIRTKPSGGFGFLQTLQPARPQTRKVTSRPQTRKVTSYKKLQRVRPQTRKVTSRPQTRKVTSYTFGNNLSGFLGSSGNSPKKKKGINYFKL
jgi:hypothetical protein